MNHILTGKQFADKDLLEKILSRAGELAVADENKKVPKLLVDKVVASIFYEPSTRTRLSFEAAALRLGAGVISAENASENSSAQKGETIEDTIKVINGYCDLIILRHPLAGASDRASQVSSVPIINAGDGSHEHPTQALLDLYTIRKEIGSLENLTIAFVGDLIYGRTAHSLLPILAEYPNTKFYFVSPKELSLPEEYKKLLLEKKIQFQETQDLEAVLAEVNLVYMTRIQKERFKDIEEYNKFKDSFLLKPAHLTILKKDAVIMHPLPRVNEVDPVIDADPRAAYFRQAKNGLYIRMALLLYALDL